MEDSGIDSGDHNGESDVKLKGAQNGQNSFGVRTRLGIPILKRNSAKIDRWSLGRT